MQKKYVVRLTMAERTCLEVMVIKGKARPTTSSMPTFCWRPM